MLALCTKKGCCGAPCLFLVVSCTVRVAFESFVLYCSCVSNGPLVRLLCIYGTGRVCLVLYFSFRWLATHQPASIALETRLWLAFNTCTVFLRSYKQPSSLG